MSGLLSFIHYYVLHSFQEIDSKEAEEGRKRTSQASKKNGFTSKPAKKPPQPRKNSKKAQNVEPENDNSTMEIGKSELFYY
jgi:DNA topoisomerase-2